MKLKVGLFCVLALTAFSGCAQVEDATLSIPARDNQATSSMSLAIPMREGMRLEWTNPSDAQISGNIERFNISWERLSDNEKDMVDKSNQTGAGVDASYDFANLTDEEEHQFLVRAIISGEDPILVLNLTAMTGANYDGDGEPDSSDDDDDNDGVLDATDLCATNATDWTSNSTTDYDGDGCRDSDEDSDDDNDGVLDATDLCATNATGWTSNSTTDYDGDGCRDSDEDPDNDSDNDGVLDATDLCATNATDWTSNSTTDYDSDGCRDSDEDPDDDNDGVLDATDLCATNATDWTSDPTTDYDGDGCRDSDEDTPIFEQDSYAFEFPPGRTGRINEVTVRNPVTAFVLGGMTTNLTIDTQVQTGVLSAVGVLAAGVYMLHVNASNAVGETRANITLNVTDTPTMQPVFSRERTVIRLSPGDTYTGEPNLFFQDSVTIAEAEYGGEKVPGRGNFTELGDIFGFDAAGNFSINQSIDVSDTRGLFLRINASNSTGESEAFVHILVTDPSNRTLYFASDGSVETIGEVHPVMPDNATRRFNITSGNQTLFGINNTDGTLSVQDAPQDRTHYLGIEEEYAGGTRFFANVTVFGKTPDGGNITHYVYWLAENEWLKPDRSEALPNINASAGDQLVFLCPRPMLATAFPGPNIWYTQNRTVADNCRPDRFAEAAQAFFIGACDAAGKEITVPLEVPLDAGNPVRFEADNSYYLMSFSGGAEEETTSREFKTGAACQSGMKFRLNVLPPNMSP